MYFGAVQVLCVVERRLAGRAASDAANLLHSAAVGEATVLLRNISISLP